MTRIVAGALRRAAHRHPGGLRHPPHLGPGPRGALQRRRVASRPGRRPRRRPLRRLRRGRPGGALPGCRARAAGRVRPARRPRHTGEHRHPAGRTRRPAGHRPRRAGARRRTRRRPVRHGLRRPAVRRPRHRDHRPAHHPGRPVAGWPRRRWWSSSAPAAPATSSGWRASPGCAAGVTGRQLFGTVADHETCGLSRLLRSGHQRSPRHHRPGQSALRRGDRRRADQPVEDRPVHHRGAHRDAP